MRVQKPTTTSLLLGFCLLNMLAACSGDGANSSSGSNSTPSAQPPPATSAEGLWNGTTSTSRTISGLVLNDGSYWFLYSVIGNPNVVAGVVQGNGNSRNGSFASSDTKDFNLEGNGILDATVTANYVEKKSLNGTLTYQSGGTGSFTSTYAPDYELTPDVNLVAGNYSGLTADNEEVTVTLSSAGTISGGSTSGCTFTGSFSPHAGANAFDVVISFGGGVCINGTDTVNGIAFYDATIPRLYSAALNSSRTNGFLSIGTKL